MKKYMVVVYDAAGRVVGRREVTAWSRREAYADVKAELPHHVSWDATAQGEDEPGRN